VISGDPLAQKLTSASWPSEFGNQANDGIVPLASQLNNPNPNSLFVFKGVHSPGTESLGLLPPSELDADSLTPDQVVDLLNQRTDNSPWFQH
jgi:hypothetical protein